MQSALAVIKVYRNCVYDSLRESESVLQSVCLHSSRQTADDPDYLLNSETDSFQKVEMTLSTHVSKKKAVATMILKSKRCTNYLSLQ